MSKGTLIVIEGSGDGVGKTTQFVKLYNRLNEASYVICKHHFPTYDSYQGKPVERYLSGDYGETASLSPYFINSLYAVDRAITWNTKLKSAYESGEIVLLDRYTTSSLIYQSALINDLDEKINFLNYVSDFEYNKLGIKEPDMTIFLHAPFEYSLKMIQGRLVNKGVKNDIHERNTEYMRKVYESSVIVANHFGWEVVEVVQDGQIRDIEDIHEEIYGKVKTLLKHK